MDRSIRVSYIQVFFIFYGILLLTRLMVLTGNNTLPLNWILIEILYILFALVILVKSQRRNFCIKKTSLKSIIPQILLLMHTILFGKVIVNSSILEYIDSNFKSQLIFLVIVILTAAVFKRYKALNEFIKISFYVISIFMIIQLILHFNEISLGNIINIFNTDERTRGTLGFGHPNILGNICVCNIVLWILNSKFKTTKLVRCIQNALLCISVIMLLCSASRSAITSIMIYFLVIIFVNLGSVRISKRGAIGIRIGLVVTAVAIICITFSIFPIQSFLVAANRAHLFKYTLPVFFSSDRILFGLGYASNAIYGENLTPYLTLFIDNGYIYILVTTGIVGAIIIFMAMVLIGIGVLSQKKSQIYAQMMGILFIYLYVALFEATLFNSGFLINYVYLILFLTYIGYDMRGEIYGENRKQKT